MALKIIRATDAVKVTILKVLLYGQPGLGKTSLAFTCNAPLCLDFDKGAYRSKQRKDALDIGTWSDVVELMKTPAALAPYQIQSGAVWMRSPATSWRNPRSSVTETATCPCKVTGNSKAYFSHGCGS